MRKSFKQYITALGRWGWVAMADIILSSVGAYLDISNTASIPMWLWGTFLLIGLIVAPFWAFHKLRVERDELQDILSARPKMEMHGSPYVDKRGIFSVTEIEGQYPLIGEPFFAHVKFHNNPEVRRTETTARNIVAEITIFDNESKKLLDVVYGRWADTKQPGTLSPFEPIRNLYQVEFEPNGLPRELDIALKYPEDEDCYAFSNESCRSRDWKIPRFLLKGNKFRVRVSLVGGNVDRKEWWFMLYNEGKDAGMRIETIN